MPTATSGQKWLTKVYDGAAFNTLAKQQGGNLNLEANGIEITNKDSNNWGEWLHGVRQWTLNCDGLIVEDDDAYLDLLNALNTEVFVTVQILTPAANLFQGTAMVETFPHDFGYSDGAKYQVNLKGNGEPTKFFTP